MATIVLGGGVAGSATALELARSGIEVSLFEAAGKVRWKIGETLASDANPALLSLDILRNFRHCGHLECHGNLSRWGSDVAWERELIFHPHGNAWQLDRAAFETSLLDSAREAGCEILRGITVESLERSGGRWMVRAGGQEFSASAIVDATGRRSWLAKRLGIRRLTFDRLVAIYCVAHSKTPTDSDSRTIIESRPDGWWYTALTPGGRRTFSFQTDGDLITDQKWRHPSWFLSKLSEAKLIAEPFHGHAYKFDSPPRLTSAHSGRLTRFHGQGWLAVGDSAMTFDPLSGQGMTKALESGIMGGRFLASGGQSMPQEFEAWHESRWQSYMENRERFYGSERRWKDLPFWRRRQSQENGGEGSPRSTPATWT